MNLKKPILSALFASALLLTGCHTPSSTATAAAPAPTPAPAAATANIAGQWAWTCCEGNYLGEMTLQQNADKITGRIFDNNDTTGGAVEGSVSGSTVSLTRTWGDDFRQDYTLTVSDDGKKLAGKFDGTQDTRYGAHFEATRK
ncbi:MAG: hypothetical protein P4N60_04470 [Verrucomicrobiae bacterium]|nr:hypothetical protein [Verrucomicrobiae bacterium]